MIQIELPRTAEPVTALPFSGSNPAGDTVAVNSRYLTRNGKPWFPVSGEFHFSRYRMEDWKRELCKMKSGGITLVSSYIFWIHHEEEEGVWDFSGQRDLRTFVRTCGEVGLPILLRIGPWCHGECRNGGFPDWIKFQKRFRTRTNDPDYLYYVRRWYTRIAEEIRGLLWEDGGPIIGVQIENEYQDYAEPDRDRRSAHMRTLRAMAEDCGFRVPIYTATAWGNATLNEMETLPVLGGYA
ncbi:MAG: beta-galactosidase, partial [Clostridium sp.]|nr:beta-galactosidase [Clostridium sp.]